MIYKILCVSVCIIDAYVCDTGDCNYLNELFNVLVASSSRNENILFDFFNIFSIFDEISPVIKRIVFMNNCKHFILCTSASHSKCSCSIHITNENWNSNNFFFSPFSNESGFYMYVFSR